MDETTYDVVVIGGGAAGSAGATALARSRRSVLVVDDGQPRNAAAGHVHNYLGREGTPPAELYRVGRAEAEQYGARVRHARAVAAGATPGVAPGFVVDLDDGTHVSARRLLVTSGATDRLPDVPGLAERWGRDVLHCPYCHGWEVRDQAIGVLATTPFATHQALLFRQLSADVVVLDAGCPVGADDRRRLLARGVRIVSDEVVEVVVTGDRLVGVRLGTGEVLARDALTVASYVEARSAVLDGLGATVEPFVMGGVEMGTQVVVDSTGRTSVPGVWAAGNVATINAQVITAAGAGLMAGGQINMDLVEEETARAVTELEEAS